MAKYDERHGGAYDRGAADSYYRRGYRPHYFKGGTYMSEEVTIDRMSPGELEAYDAGYEGNEAEGNFKDYG